MIKNTKILNMGSGFNHIPNSISIDKNRLSHPDIVHDLNKFPYPFKANVFNKIIATNVIEHLENIIKVMEEIHRISKPNAIIEITTGHFSSVDSFTDPTHIHSFTSRTFDFFIPGTDLYKYRYSKVKFRLINIMVGPKNSKNIVLKLILKLINQHLKFYESRLAFIFPVGVIYYKLQVMK